MGVIEAEHIRQRRHGEANQPFIGNTVVVEIEMLMCITRL
jgi:hypothetical protein